MNNWTPAKVDAFHKQHAMVISEYLKKRIDPSKAINLSELMNDVYKLIHEVGTTEIPRFMITNYIFGFIGEEIFKLTHPDYTKCSKQLDQLGIDFVKRNWDGSLDLVQVKTSRRLDVNRVRTNEKLCRKNLKNLRITGTYSILVIIWPNFDSFLPPFFIRDIIKDIEIKTVKKEEI